MKNNILFFLLFPFLGLVQAFRHTSASWSKNMVMLFVVFYGYTMYINPKMDSSRYVTKLEFMNSHPVDFDMFLLSLYDEEGNNIDVYQPGITFLLSIFTGNGHILMAVFGIVFGFFYSRNMWMILEEVKDDYKTPALWSLWFSLMCIVGFWSLNGVRMWTAAHIFFYGVILLMLKNKRIGWLYIFLTVLVHYSFIVLISVFILGYLLKKLNKLPFLLYYISFFISELNISSVRDAVSSFLPDFLKPRVLNYISEGYIEVIDDLNKGASWNYIMQEKLMNWVTFILLVYISFNKIKKIRNDVTISHFLNVCLLLLTLGNIMSNVPSGTRYLIVSNLLSISFVFLYLTKNQSDQNIKMLSKLGMPFFLLYIFISLRLSIETISVSTVLSNPLIATVNEVTTPIIEYIK